MGIELPNPGGVFIPQVPKGIADEATRDYLQRLRRAVSDSLRDLFSNDIVIQEAVNSGTSGTFVISSGGSIVVTSGVVISVTS